MERTSAASLQGKGLVRRVERGRNRYAAAARRLPLKPDRMSSWIAGNDRLRRLLRSLDIRAIRIEREIAGKRNGVRKIIVGRRRRLVKAQCERPSAVGRIATKTTDFDVVSDTRVRHKTYRIKIPNTFS